MKTNKFHQKIMESYKVPKRKLRFMLIFSTVVLLVAAVALMIFGEWLLVLIGWVTEEQLTESWLITVCVSGLACLVIGSILSWFVGRFLLRPMDELIDGMAKLSSGQFDTRLHFGKNKSMKTLADGFNSLARELENTEILRSDFINDFSHEFKTPLASISGLAKLMKTEDLPKEKQQEYLRIIEEESDRLSDMTTNILTLSKVQSQNILTDTTTFNLSEQLRTCVLLLEKKWSNKELTLDLDFEEYDICGNESILKQVWLNLLDNAIKFSDRGGELSIAIAEGENTLSVSVSDTGAEIGEEDLGKIFNKFYQVDSSHEKEGNGIGLSIVKHIVELHRGTVRAESGQGRTTFTVTLPKE